jgi:hypothetical protein
MRGSIVALAMMAALGTGCADRAGQDARTPPRLAFPAEIPFTSHPRASFGPACPAAADGAPPMICLGLRYVAYAETPDAPVVTGRGALDNVAAINRIFAPCAMGFQIDEYLPVHAEDFGLRHAPASLGEVSAIRAAFASPASLLVVTTGGWTGTLGAGAANAWTTLPGSPPYGAVLEAAFGDYPNLIAHELAHYLNLDHVADPANLLNPVIYSDSTQLTGEQCRAMRAAATVFWPAQIR